MTRMKPADEFELHLRAAKVPPPEKEHRFHPKRRWRLDYAWPAERVAVEVHGGVHVQGRHTRGVGFVNDREKANQAQLMGWTYLEVCPEQIRSGAALEWVERALGLRKPKE